MPKTVLLSVGERPAVFNKFKVWRNDLSDEAILQKMSRLPSTIRQCSNQEEAERCKADFESCIGTSVSVE